MDDLNNKLDDAFWIVLNFVGIVAMVAFGVLTVTVVGGILIAVISP